MAMNPEIKKLWVEALRSGEYKQGKGYLKDVTGDEPAYCCLGVLTDLCAKERGLRWGRTEYFDGRKVQEFHDTKYFLPRPVREWSGLGIEAPIVAFDGAHLSLVKLNDTREASFTKIADAIEASL